ncbi:MFS transporter [Pectinatus sottacetonis]|uniref:MFS transporter n=1 Tax=Pectinatus sottacetonis TaxID=1002795 RepID=UPI001E59F6BD|nr:MFS transporter [Pectinatus sottacetonis]
MIPKEIKTALLMAASLFMAMLDGTIVITALPRMAQYFNMSMATVSLLISAYLITSAIFIPLSAWMVSQFGKKKIWLAAVFIFTLSSLANAVAPNFCFLLLTRIIQGISSSLMLPTARLIVLEKAPTARLLEMVSYLIWPALIAPVIAPLVGGFIITYWSWQWIFLINIPIGLVIILLGIVLIDADEVNSQTGFDLLGFIEIAVSSGIILLGAELATHGRNYWYAALGLVIAGIVLGFIVYRHLQKTSVPLFSVNALKITSFRICQTSGSVLWLCVGALPYILTIFLQTIFHWSAIKAGSYVLFIFIGNIGIKPFTNFIIRRIGYRSSLLVSFGMIFITSIALAFITNDTIAGYIIVLAVISGAGRSLALTNYSGLCFSEVSPEDRNSANTLNAVIQTLSQGLGISLITVVINLLQIIVSISVAYKLGFIFLGLLMIPPVCEVFLLPKSIGQFTLTKQ